jgi:hypothetical protein
MSMRYIEIPGNGMHELPPLLVHVADREAEEGIGALASVMSEAEDMMGTSDDPAEVVEQRKYDLAVKLAEQYNGLISSWFWGDSVLEWIRQCEITFQSEANLRPLLHPDLWPHASRASFVTLLADKGLTARQPSLERAVGLRLTFRQPPPIDCFSSQFLFYLNSTMADSAYQTWSHLTRQEAALLPPHRFHFEVLDMRN